MANTSLTDGGALQAGATNNTAVTDGGAMQSVPIAFVGRIVARLVDASTLATVADEETVGALVDLSITVREPDGN